MKEGLITVEDGRRVAFADYGTPDQTPVVWCHGGPVSRLEPEICAAAADQAGLRLIGIDRPGYGRSTPRQRAMTEAFAPGFGGYVDDWLADGSGWGTFDVSAIACPVVVLHGSGDTLVPVANAHHTAALVPGATLRIVDRLGHLSIVVEMVSAIRQVLACANLPTSPAAS